MRNKILGVLATIALVTNAQAGVLSNDSYLVGGYEHQMLSQMLGMDMDLTRVYAKQAGDTSHDWHAAVDAFTQTFTIMEIFDPQEGVDGTRRVIGGYFAPSWGAGGWVSDPSYTSFLFNLNSGVKFAMVDGQSIRAGYSSGSYGPTFGGGHDLFLNTNLSGGGSNIGYSYGDSARYTESAYKSELTYSNNWSVGHLETFTLSSSTGDFDLSHVAEGGVAQPVQDVNSPLLAMFLFPLFFCGVRKRRHPFQ